MHFPEFSELLRKSRLISEEELRLFIDRFHAICPDYERDPDAAQRFADELRSSGLLTSWQIKMLLEKKHKGFFLGRYKLCRALGEGRYAVVRDDGERAEMVVLPKSRNINTHYVVFRPESYLDHGAE